MDLHRDAVRCAEHGIINDITHDEQKRSPCALCNAVTTSMAAPEPHRARFRMDARRYDIFEDWFDGDDWKGWAIPYFDRWQAFAIIAAERGRERQHRRRAAWTAHG